jgi:hypothetical protein
MRMEMRRAAAAPTSGSATDDLRTLNRITRRDLEVVDTSGLVNTP